MSELRPEPAATLRRQLVEVAAQTPRGGLPGLLGLLAEAQAMALARLTVPDAEDQPRQAPDGNVSVAEAARRLGVSPSYIYKNAKVLPFVVRIGRRRVCSASRLERWNRGRLGT